MMMQTIVMVILAIGAMLLGASVIDGLMSRCDVYPDEDVADVIMPAKSAFDILAERRTSAKSLCSR